MKSETICGRMELSACTGVAENVCVCERRPDITPTRDVKAPLEDLVQGPGVVVVVSQQLGAVAHHGPATSTLILLQRKTDIANLYGLIFPP